MFHVTSFVSSGTTWARVGVAYKLSSGATLGTAQATIVPNLHGCVTASGGGEFTVNPGQVSGNDENYEVLTGWLPAAGASGIVVPLCVMDNASTTLENQVVVRSCIDPKAPNAWQLAEAGWSNPAAGNSERNSGELAIPAAVSASSNSQLQVALAWRRKSGSASNPRASLSAMVLVLRG